MTDKLTNDTELSVVLPSKISTLIPLNSEVKIYIQNLNFLNQKLTQQIEILKKTVAEQDELLKRAIAENKRRNEILASFQKELFSVGNSSEAKALAKLNKENQAKKETEQYQEPIQLSLFADNSIFNEIELRASNELPEKELDIEPTTSSKTNSSKKRKKKNKISMVGEDLLKLNLPVKTVYLDDINNKADTECSVCKTPMQVIGEELVSRNLMYTPAKYWIEEVKRRTYVCRNCEQENRKSIFKKPTPEALLPHSIVSPSLLANVVTKKFVQGLPFYRQEQDLVFSGLPMTRNLLTTWSMKVFENQVAPLCELLKEKLIKNIYIHADETRIEILKSTENGAPKLGYMWVYTTTKWNSQPIIYFDYAPGRSNQYPEKFLKNYEGYLHTDCYAGYEKLTKSQKIKRCLCLVHLRRYFYRAFEVNSPDSNDAKLALKAITMIDEVFKNEREYTTYSAEQRCEARLLNTQPILDKFFAWCIKAKDVVLPKSKLGEALSYALKGQDDFMTFLEDGNCDISNNHVENSIRPFVIGRKNYLFHITNRGANVSAGYYSLIETAKANGLDPQEYLKWIFRELPHIRPKSNTQLLERLLPWSTEAIALCKANTIESLSNS